MVAYEQNTLSFTTDTATPVTPIPIFYLHADEHPFCSNIHCLCHANEATIRELLNGVLDGNLKLRKAYNGVIVGGEIK